MNSYPQALYKAVYSINEPLQYSFLENPMDREALWTIVHGVAKSQTQVSTHAMQQQQHK